MVTADQVQFAARQRLVALGGDALVRRMSGATSDVYRLLEALRDVATPQERLQIILHTGNWHQPLGFYQARAIEKATTKMLEQMGQGVGAFRRDPVDACLDLLAGTDELQESFHLTRGSCEHFNMTHKDRMGAKPYYWPTDAAAFAYLQDVQTGKRPLSQPLRQQTRDLLVAYEATRKPRLGSESKAAQLRELRRDFVCQLAGQASEQASGQAAAAQQVQAEEPVRPVRSNIVPLSCYRPKYRR